MVTLVWGKMKKLTVLVMKSHKTNSLEPTTIESHSNTAQGLTHAPTISHEDEKTGARSKFWGGGRVGGPRICHPPYHPP